MKSASYRHDLFDAIVRWSTAPWTTPADERRVRFVAIVGAVALIVGVVGLILVQRRRRRPVAPRQDEGRAAQQRPRPDTRGRVCPTCREEYPSAAQYCERDGNRLLPSTAADEPRGALGGVCPVCGRGYDPGVAACPTHHEPLVPPVVPVSTAALTSGVRVCPACGARYRNRELFCRIEGAPLAPLN